MRAVAKLKDPTFIRRFNLWAAVIWFIAAFPICIYLKTSVAFLVFVSVYAVVTGHWGTAQAASAEETQTAAIEDVDEGVDGLCACGCALHNN